MAVVPMIAVIAMISVVTVSTMVAFIALGRQIGLWRNRYRTLYARRGGDAGVASGGQIAAARNCNRSESEQYRYC